MKVLLKAAGAAVYKAEHQNQGEATSLKQVSDLVIIDTNLDNQQSNPMLTIGCSLL